VPELTSVASGPLLVFVCAAASVACGRPVDDRECRALLDRYTEFLVREENPGATPARVAHDQEAARTAALRDPKFEFSECSRRVSRRAYECAMNAPNVDAMERCLIL
jgi:hypothetical protein